MACALLATGLLHASACNPVDPEVDRVDGAMYTTPGGTTDAGIVDGGSRDGGDAGRRDGGDAAR